MKFPQPGFEQFYFTRAIAFMYFKYDLENCKKFNLETDI